MNRLSHFGSVQPLDGESAYHAEYALTAGGRAEIITSMLSYRTILCGLTAAWVWHGGDFPETLDIISASHFRTMIHGRRIRAFNRKTPQEHVTRVGGATLTTPLWTACEIALLPEEEVASRRVESMILSLMEEYQFLPSDCLRILEEHHFWPFATRARRLLHLIGRSFSSARPHQKTPDAT